MTQAVAAIEVHGPDAGTAQHAVHGPPRRKPVPEHNSATRSGLGGRTNAVVMRNDCRAVVRKANEEASGRRFDTRFAAGVRAGTDSRVSTRVGRWRRSRTLRDLGRLAGPLNPN